MIINYLLKKNMPAPPKTIKNVLQIDLSNMAVLNDEVSDSDWNFVSILFEENGEKKKIVIKLEDVWQFTCVRSKD